MKSLSIIFFPNPPMWVTTHMLNLVLLEMTGSHSHKNTESLLTLRKHELTEVLMRLVLYITEI